MPLYPSKVLEAKECASTPYSSAIFSFGLTFESLKDMGARHLPSIWLSLTISHLDFNASKL
jgi:hypothetical protein